MRESIYDLEEVQIRVYDLALLLKREGIGSFLPQTVNQRFYIHYGSIIPWEDLGYASLDAFMVANPGFTRMADDAERFVCLLKEGYEITYTIPVPSDDAIPLVDLEAEPDFLDLDFRHDPQEIPLFSPFCSPARSPCRSPPASPSQEVLQTHYEAPRGVLHELEHPRIYQNFWTDFDAAPAERVVTSVQPNPGVHRDLSPPPPVFHVPALTPETMKAAASSLLFIKQKREAESSASAFTRSPAVQTRMGGWSQNMARNPQEKEIGLPTFSRAAAEITPAKQLLDQDDRPTTSRSSVVAPRLIPASPVPVITGRQQLHPQTSSRSTEGILPPAGSPDPVNVGQPPKIARCPAVRTRLGGWSTPARSQENAFPLPPPASPDPSPERELAPPGEQQFQALTSSRSTDGILPPTASPDPVNAVQSPAITRSCGVPTRMGGWSTRTGDEPEEENKLPAAVPDSTFVGDVTSAVPQLQKPIENVPIIASTPTKKNVPPPAAATRNTGRPTVKVGRASVKVEQRMDYSELPPPASPEPSPERELAPPAKEKEKSPRKITRARTIKSFRKIVEDSKNNNKEKEKEEVLVLNKDKRGALAAAVAEFCSKTGALPETTSPENEGKEADKVPPAEEPAVPLKLSNFLPSEKDEPEKSVPEKPAVSFAIQTRAKTVRPTKLFPAATEDDEERVVVEKATAPSRAKTRPSLHLPKPSHQQASMVKANAFVDKVLACLKERGKTLELEVLAEAYRKKFYPSFFFHDLKEAFSYHGFEQLEKLSFGQIIVEKGRNPHRRDDDPTSTFRYSFHLRSNRVPIVVPSPYTSAISSSSSSSFTAKGAPPSTRQRSRWTSSSSSSSASRSPRRKRSREKSPGKERENQKPKSYCPTRPVTCASSSPKTVPVAPTPRPKTPELSAEAQEQFKKLLEAQKIAPVATLGPRPQSLATFYHQETSKEAADFSDRLISLLVALGGHAPFSALESAFLNKYQESFAALCTQHLPAEAPFNQLRLISNGRVEAEVLPSNSIFFHLKHSIDVLFDGIVVCLQELGGVGDLKTIAQTFKTMFNQDFHVLCRAEFGANPFQLLPDIVKIAGKFVVALQKTNWIFALSFKHLSLQTAAAKRFWEVSAKDSSAPSIPSNTPDTSNPSVASKLSVIDVFFDRIMLCLDKIDQATTFLTVAKLYVSIYKQELLKVANVFFGSVPYATMSEVGIQKRKFSLSQVETVYWFKAPDGSALKPIGPTEPINQKTPHHFTPQDSIAIANSVREALSFTGIHPEEKSPARSPQLRSSRSSVLRRGRSRSSQTPPPRSPLPLSPRGSVVLRRGRSRSSEVSPRSAIRPRRSPSISHNKLDRSSGELSPSPSQPPSRRSPRRSRSRSRHDNFRSRRYSRSRSRERRSRSPWFRRSRSRGRSIVHRNGHQEYERRNPRRGRSPWDLHEMSRRFRSRHDDGCRTRHSRSRSPQNSRSRDPRSVRRTSKARSPINLDPLPFPSRFDISQFKESARQNIPRPWHPPSGPSSRGNPQFHSKNRNGTKKEGNPNLIPLNPSNTRFGHQFKDSSRRGETRHSPHRSYYKSSQDRFREAEHRFKSYRRSPPRNGSPPPRKVQRKESEERRRPNSPKPWREGEVVSSDSD